MQPEDLNISYEDQDVEFCVTDYKYNDRAGVAIAYVKGTGEYCGMKIVKYKILTKNLEVTATTK